MPAEVGYAGASNSIQPAPIQREQQLQTEQSQNQQQEQLSRVETSAQTNNASNTADPDARLGTQIDVTV